MNFPIVRTILFLSFVFIGGFNLSADEAVQPIFDASTHRAVITKKTTDSDYSMTVSFKHGDYEGMADFSITLVPKNARESWLTGTWQNFRTKDKQKWSGGVSVSNFTEKGFDVIIKIVPIPSTNERAVKDSFECKWIPNQEIKKDGISISVAITKNKKA